MTKYIVVIGGVISGVGKGVATASIGKILKEYGYSVTAIKIDPYINVDAGTLRPTEHGEVWVTDDGGEIDQDLGNYERFLDIDIPKKNSITTGQIYKNIIAKERRGDYLGQTVQFIPHVANEIKNRIIQASKGYDFALIEIGGVVGDYENVPFLFAMKNWEKEIKPNNIIYILVTYLFAPRHIKEMKTKPTQQAIKMLTESSGIAPDFVLCRSEEPLDKVRKEKIETYANISSDYIISAPDVTTIYQVPINLTKENIGSKILDKLNVKPKTKINFAQWNKWINNILQPKHTIKIAIIGKYINSGDFTLTDSYLSIKEALTHCGAHLNTKIEIEWLDAKSLEKNPKNVDIIKQFDGIIVPGGFGTEGTEGKILAINYARTHNIPYLGLCYGMQLALIEFARNVCKMKNANTTEINPNTPYPIIDFIPMQKEFIQNHAYGGTMRLGAYGAIINKKSLIYNLYKKTKRIEIDKKQIKILQKDKQNKFRLGKLNKNTDTIILERHRHRYEVNPKYVETLEKAGIKFTGYHVRNDGTKLMEFIELPQHKFFVATQAHPEFKSRLNNPAPLFLGFVKACLSKTNKISNSK